VSANHTPGPWHFVDSPLKTGWLIVVGGNYLADVHKHIGTTADDVRDESNARLIAAAPELLEALESLLAVSECADETGYVTDAGFVDIDELHAEVREALSPNDKADS